MKLNFPNPFKRKSRLDALQEQLDRGDWIREIENTRGFRLIKQVLVNEKAFTLTKLRRCTPEELLEFQTYYEALDFIDRAIIQWQREGEVARNILFPRAEEIEKMEFVESQPNTPRTGTGD